MHKGQLVAYAHPNSSRVINNSRDFRLSHYNYMPIVFEIVDIAALLVNVKIKDATYLSTPTKEILKRVLNVSSLDNVQLPRALYASYFIPIDDAINSLSSSFNVGDIAYVSPSCPITPKEYIYSKKRTNSPSCKIIEVRTRSFQNMPSYFKILFDDGFESDVKHAHLIHYHDVYISQDTENGSKFTFNKPNKLLPENTKLTYYNGYLSNEDNTVSLDFKKFKKLITKIK